MVNLIVLFPKLEEGKSIRNILVRNGFSVDAVCTTGAQALQYADSLNEGIVVCGYRYVDMMYTELHEDLPPYFEMLLVASQEKGADCVENDIVCVAMPVKVHDLLNTLAMMEQNIVRRRKKRRMQPKQRSAEEETYLCDAKAILMERNNMTENEAHRYLQKCSMDSGTNIVEAAQMVLRMMD